MWQTMLIHVEFEVARLSSTSSSIYLQQRLQLSFPGGDVMIFSRAQMAALNDGFVDQIVQRISSFVDQKCDFSAPYDGTLALPPGKARDAAIKHLIICARGDFGILDERAMTQFAILGLGYSRTFYEIPKVRDILVQADLTPSQRIQLVLDLAVQAEERMNHAA